MRTTSAVGDDRIEVSDPAAAAAAAAHSVVHLSVVPYPLQSSARIRGYMFETL